MEPTASPMLSLMPLAATTPDGAVGLENLQKMAVTGDNTALEMTGMFSSILSQLTPEQPVAGPVLTEAAVVLPILAPEIAAEALPPAGNFLPLPTYPASLATIRPVVNDSLTDTATDAVTNTVDQSELLPLTGIPQPAQNLVITTSVAANPSAAAAPVAAAIAGHSVLAKPPTQNGPSIAHAPGVEPGVVTEIPTAAIVAVTKDIPIVERLENAITQQLTNQQPVQSVAPDNATVVTTANPATPQALSAPTTSQSQPSFVLDHPVTDARWGDSLGQRVVWMSENGMGRAEIRLNPPELGPLHVRVTVANDEAKVAFTVQHGTTREMVEAALPRLREMFASQGIELTDASVSQHSPDDRRQAADTGDSSGRSKYGSGQNATAFDEADDFAGSTIVREGLIDTYV